MPAIVGVRVDRVRVSFRRPFRTASGPWTARDSFIVRVRDDAGRVWAGEAPVSPADAGGGRLLGPDDPRLAAALADAADALARGVAESPASVGVNATLETAATDTLVAEAAAAVAAGFRTVKLKVGPERSTAELRDRIAAVRDAVGHAARIRLDANGAWDEATAIERLAAVAPLGIELAEQPIPPGDARALARVRAAGGVPVAADEGVTSFTDAERLLIADAVDALVLKPARLGGQAAARRIGELALSAGVPVVLSTLFETGIGIGRALDTAAFLAGVLPPGVAALDHGLATADLLEDDLVVGAAVVDGGRLRAHGVVPDAAAIDRWRTDEPLLTGDWG